MAFPAGKKKPTVDLAILMGGGGGPKKPPREMDDMPEEGMGDEAMESSEPAGEGAFDVAFEEFNDASLSPEERKAAFKRAVMACQEEGY